MAVPAAVPSGALKEEIRRRGIALGLDAVGFASPDLPQAARHLSEWLSMGYQAGMAYLRRRLETRLDPQSFFPGVRTVIAAALNYYQPDPQPSETTTARPPRISRYAWGRDYHRILPKRLRRLLEEIRELAPATRGKVAVDTSPVMDKLWAVAAGLGWQGKHTNLITRSLGSWVFVGTLWIDLELPPDAPEPDHCGSCTRCLEACPTQAFPGPYILDARRCLAYWTVEHRAEFGPETPDLDGWLFGCDICQDVCPWSKFQQPAHDPDLRPRERLLSTSLETWRDMDEKTYDDLTRGSALRRARREGLQRNARRLLEDRGHGEKGDAAWIP